MGFIYSMKPFIVNLADDSGGRYLKVKFEMELNSKDLVPEVEKRMPQLTDSVIMLLSSRKYEDIVTYEGKDRMRNEIMLRLNSFLSTGFIRKIYFTEFVMQ
jgi:flagellar FliL protein